MIFWLDTKDIKDMGLSEGKWYHLLIEYDPTFNWAMVKVNNQYWGILKGEKDAD